MAKFDFEQTKREAKIRFDDLTELLETDIYVDFLKKGFPGYKTTPAKILKANIVDFMLYVATADREISQYEYDLITYITGWNVSLDSLRDFASENNIFETEKTEAVTFQMVCEIENHWARIGGDDNGLVRRAVKLFEMVSDLVIHKDGKPNKYAKKRAKEYLKTNKKFVKKHTLCPSNKGLV